MKTIRQTITHYCETCKREHTYKLKVSGPQRWFSSENSRIESQFGAHLAECQRESYILQTAIVEYLITKSSPSAKFAAFISGLIYWLTSNADRIETYEDVLPIYLRFMTKGERACYQHMPAYLPSREELCSEMWKSIQHLLDYYTFGNRTLTPDSDMDISIAQFMATAMNISYQTSDAIQTIRTMIQTYPETLQRIARNACTMAIYARTNIHVMRTTKNIRTTIESGVVANINRWRQVIGIE